MLQVTFESQGKFLFISSYIGEVCVLWSNKASHGYKIGDDDIRHSFNFYVVLF